MLPLLRTLLADIQLPEGPAGQHLTVGAPRLIENLLAMRDEQQRLTQTLVAQPLIVERSDDRLTGAGRGDDEVAVSVVCGALRIGRGCTSKPDNVIEPPEPPSVASALFNRSASRSGS